MLGLGLAAPQQGSGWWPRGALYAADFRKHRYMAGGRSITPAAAFSLTRGGEALAPDSAGSYQGFAAHVPARTDLGLFSLRWSAMPLRTPPGPGQAFPPPIH
ncbi:hypothetical protein V6L77_16965 [Pannonibacter sp. Pt2-lr]